MKTKTIFRKFPEGDIIALFPEIPGTNEYWTCQSYQHIGQHGAADTVHITMITKPATKEESAGLFNELKRIGYDMEMIKRFRYSHMITRMEQLK